MNKEQLSQGAPHETSKRGTVPACY